MENLYSFRIPPGEVREISPEMDTGCTMEVNVVEGGPVYVFRSRVTADEAIRGMEANNEGFIAGASGTAKAQLSTEAQFGSVTLFNNNAIDDAIGFLRVTGSNR